MEHKNQTDFDLARQATDDHDDDRVTTFSTTGAVTPIIMHTSEQKAIADNLDAVANGYALTVNGRIAARMAMVTSTLYTITLDDKPIALTVMNQPCKGRESFRIRHGLGRQD
jgi:hypothetical protein